MILSFPDGKKLLRVAKTKTDLGVLREQETGRLNLMLINAK